MSSPDDPGALFEWPYHAHVDAWMLFQAEQQKREAEIADQAMLDANHQALVAQAQQNAMFLVQQGVTFNNFTSMSPSTVWQGNTVLSTMPFQGGTIGPGTVTVIHRPNPMTDPKQPDTLGWREWIWDDEHKCLKSPSMGTLWPTADLRAEAWDSLEVIRGKAGIHAVLVPKHWKILHELNCSPLGGSTRDTVSGIVERFGKYVLGTEGWRAEQVVIRELLAPSTEIGLELEQRYPDVIIHYSDQTAEGETPCTSETSSRSVSGSRSLLPSLPSPQPPLPPIHIKRPMASQLVRPNTLSQAIQLPGGTILFQQDEKKSPLERNAGWLATLWCVVGAMWGLLAIGWLMK